MTVEDGHQPRQVAPSSDELLRLVVESTTGFAIVSTDSRGLVTSWNVGAERLLGYAEPEILGRSVDVVFTPEDRAMGLPDAERTTAAAAGKAPDERWHLRKDGSRFWASGLLMPLADGNGFVKIVRDLTDNRVAQEQLEASEALFRLLAVSIPQLVFRTNGNGERTWPSPQWIAFTGMPFDDNLGFGWLEAVHPDDRQMTMEAWNKARETGEYYVEHRIRRSADGEYRWHQTRARPPADDGDDTTNWVGTSSDVHDMYELQERQNVLLAELQHRTRNLLAVVQSIARQTLRVSGSLDVFEKDFEGRLRALGRVQSLLARVDHGAIDLRTLLDAELAAHGGKGDPDKVWIEGPTVYLPATSAQVFALAIHELVTNAVKYGALRQPIARLSVTWSVEDARAESRRVVLDWQETGVDMPEQGIEALRKGYGSELITRALPYQLKAETSLEFAHDGVRCRIASSIESAETNDG